MNFNPRSPYGERLLRNWRQMVGGRISIHAPLTGSDWPAGPRPAAMCHFNPRSPYGERQQIVCQLSQQAQFQSTLPLRGATRGCPCFLEVVMISIHAPLTGSDLYPRAFSISLSLFQSTLPLRGATGQRRRSTGPARFQSTLPLRGATPAGNCAKRRNVNFNPRSPYGERPGSRNRRA